MVIKFASVEWTWLGLESTLAYVYSNVGRVNTW